MLDLKVLEIGGYKGLGTCKEDSGESMDDGGGLIGEFRIDLILNRD